jgi:hypothetical protein
MIFQTCAYPIKLPLLVLSPAASALTTTKAARLLSPCFHSMQSMPRFCIRSTKSLMSARYGTTTTVIPALSMPAGTLNSKLLPPPVGSTTTSGVCPSTTACSACSCSADRTRRPADRALAASPCELPFLSCLSASVRLVCPDCCCRCRRRYGCCRRRYGCCRHCAYVSSPF